MLTRAQIAAYRRDGFTVVPGFLRASEVALVRRELSNLRRLGAYRDRSMKGDASSFDLQWVPDWSGAVRSLLDDPRFAATVSQLIDEPYAVMMAGGYTKPARIGKGTRWHRDDYPTAQRLPRNKAVALWIAVDEVRQDNGPFMVIPNHGEDPRYVVDPDSEYRRMAAPTAEMLADSRVLEMPAGTAILFSFDTLHATGDNTSEEDRSGLSFHFACLDQFSPSFPATPHFCPLVAGVDATGVARQYGDHPGRGGWQKRVRPGLPRLRLTDRLKLRRAVVVASEFSVDGGPLEERIVLNVPSSPRVWGARAISHTDAKLLESLARPRTVAALLGASSPESPTGDLLRLLLHYRMVVRVP